MPETDLFEPCEFNGLRLANRIAMSPLTRARAASDGSPGPLQAEYYAQRASAGLLITEATAVAPEGRGGAFIPGLWDDAHIAAWRLTTEAVHARGGKIFCQLWHAGRLSHSSLHASGGAPVAPSAMRQPGKVFTEAGLVDYDEARALDLAEMDDIVEQFASAARRAKAAGFDGVEVHGAHSYLLDAFLRDMTNKRGDAYGGSIANRARLLLEVMAAVAKVFGPERTAVRLSPIGHAYNAWDSDPEPLFTHVVEGLNDLNIGWLDLVEGDTGISRQAEPSFDLSKLRRLFKGVLIANNLYDLEMAKQARRENTADIIAFGRPFIGNPDLVERLKAGAPLAVAPPRSYYGGGAQGYTDFPALGETKVSA
jgi:N-ethylmaleimide reductase